MNMRPLALAALLPALALAQEKPKESDYYPITTFTPPEGADLEGGGLDTCLTVASRRAPVAGRSGWWAVPPTNAGQRNVQALRHRHARDPRPRPARRLALRHPARGNHPVEGPGRLTTAPTCTRRTATIFG